MKEENRVRKVWTHKITGMPVAWPVMNPVWDVSTKKWTVLIIDPMTQKALRVLIKHVFPSL